jgi:serine protease Do
MKNTLVKLVSRARMALLGGALIVGLSSVALSWHVMASNGPKISRVALTVDDRPLTRSSNGTPTMSFAPVVKTVAPSVVKITVTSVPKDMPDDSSNPSEDFLRRFFGQMPQQQVPDHQFGGRGMRAPHEYGLGSGVIVNKDGYILTNNHVVEGADTIKVTLNDGREFTAKVIGRDPKSDVAVIKIDAKDLPYLKIGDSDKLEVGDLCLAVGNPFGIGQTVTMGIISAKGRGDLEMGTEYEDFIQTDAAINPGNSGGALVDSDGRLIGINTAILSRSGGYQGIGFAVPINMARHVMEGLIAHGKVIRGFLGVSIQDVTPELADEFKLADQRGALVGDVVPHDPAEKAGIKSGDVIVAFNDHSVDDSRHLRLMVADTDPGTTVPLKLIRNGHEKKLTVTVMELPGTPEEASATPDNDSNSSSLNGVTVSDIDSQAVQQLNLPTDLKGAVVTQVDENSAAYDAGLRAGDVIEEINRKTVGSADDAVKLTDHVKDKVLLLKIWSKGASHFMVVDESKSK